MAEEKKLVTTEMFLAKKKVIDKKPDAFYSETFGGYIEIENTHCEAFIATLGDETIDRTYKISRLVYENCPQFRDSVLLEEYGIKDPYELPQKIYESRLMELYELGTVIMSVYGYTEEVIEKIKKK